MNTKLTMQQKRGIMILGGIIILLLVSAGFAFKLISFEIAVLLFIINAYLLLLNIYKIKK